MNFVIPDALYTASEENIYIHSIVIDMLYDKPNIYYTLYKYILSLYS